MSLSSSPVNIPLTQERTRLEFPFDVSLAPPALDADAENDAPDQDIALKSAMLGPEGNHENSYGFFDKASKPVPLVTLEKIQQEGDSRAALALLDRRHHITLGATHTVDASNPDLTWHMKRSFLDLIVCVGNGLGLGPAIPNRSIHHALEFTLDLTRLDREFTAKHVKLGFDPTECVMWIGRSPTGEDVWLAFVTPESQEDDRNSSDDSTANRRSRKGISTALTVTHQRRVFMFLATILKTISYRDCVINKEYPMVEDLEEFKDATNLR